MTGATQTLDAEKFAKVRVMMDRGATEGERAAARTRAEAMAKRAGMTLKQAMSKMDRKAKADAPKPQQQSGGDWASAFRDAFRDAEDEMERKHPGWKAQKAQEKSEREYQRAKRRADAIDRYGSEEAVWAESERERRLRVTLEPLADRQKYMNSPKTYINGYAGWTCREPTPPLWKALGEAYPFPDNLAGVWQELQEWRRLTDDRCAFFPDHDSEIWIRAREAGLEYLMETMPARTWEETQSRMDWVDHITEQDSYRDLAEDRRLFAAVRADFAMMKAQQEAAASAPPPPPPMRRTNADKRRDVLSMMEAQPELSDREISRRCGVSPQTVSNWRAKSRTQPEERNAA